MLQNCQMTLYGPLLATACVDLIACRQRQVTLLNAQMAPTAALDAQTLFLLLHAPCSLPGLVRLGRSESVHPEVQGLHVDALAERLAGA